MTDTVFQTYVFLLSLSGRKFFDNSIFPQRSENHSAMYIHVYVNAHVVHPSTLRLQTELIQLQLGKKENGRKSVKNIYLGKIINVVYLSLWLWPSRHRISNGAANRLFARSAWQWTLVLPTWSWQSSGSVCCRIPAIEQAAVKYMYVTQWCGTWIR